MRNNVNNEINIMLTGSLLCQSILMKEKHLKDQNVDYDFNSSFNKIKRVLENSDVAIGALDIGKSDIPLDYYRSLKNNGFNLCILNSRKSNCKEIELCHESALLYITYNKGQVMDINGIKVGIICCTDDGIHDLLSNVEKELYEMKKSNAEFIISYIIWTKNYGTHVTGYQRAIATILAEIGVDYIVGAGTNTLQKYEILNVSWNRKVPVLYSLGKFINCTNFLNRASTAILNLKLIKTQKGKIEIKDSYLPCFTFTALGTSKYVVEVLNDKKYTKNKTNELVQGRKTFIASMIGEDLQISHDFDSMGNNLYCNIEVPRCDENIFNKSFIEKSIFAREIIGETTSLQKSITDSFKLTNEFRVIYGQMLFSNDSNSDLIESAIDALKKYKGEIDIEVHYDFVVDLLYSKNILGFDYYEYFGYDFQNKSILERTEFLPDQYRLNYFRRINTNQKEIDAIDNKYIAYERLKQYYKRDLVYIANASADTKDKFREFCSAHKRFIIKPVNGSLGQGIRIINVKDYENIDLLFNELISKSKYVCEEIIKQKKYLEILHPESVNSVRIFTFNNGKNVELICAWLKIGRSGSVVDNGGSGGIVAAIDIVSGQVIADGGDEKGNVFIKHPDTGITFNGIQIEEWDEIIDIVKKAALEYPDLKIIAWDVAHSENKGWQIIEGNSQGQINVIQLSTKKGFRTSFENKIGWTSNR